MYVVCIMYLIFSDQKPRERLSSNLIDLNSPPPDHNYVNDNPVDSTSNNSASSVTRDVFDMRKYFCTYILIAYVTLLLLILDIAFSFRTIFIDGRSATIPATDRNVVSYKYQSSRSRKTHEE